MKKILIIGLLFFSSIIFGENRYWIGGNGTWDLTTTTNWSTASGGVGGASVPTIDDDVFINADSSTGAFTITANVAGIICNNLTVSSLNGTLTFTIGSTDATLNVSGNLSFPSTGNKVANITAGDFNFRPKRSVGGTNTIDLGGTTLNNVFFYNQSAAGDRPPEGSYGWSISSNFVCAGSISHNGGLLSFNSWNINAVALLNSSTTYQRSVNFGSSTITLSSTASSVISDISTPTNLTSFNAGTSTLILTGATTIFSPSGLTFYNVSFTNTAQTSITINSNGTFNNFTIAPSSAAWVNTVTLTSGQTLTINGTLSINSGSTNPRIRAAIVASTIGSVATINAPTESLTDVDFRDITATHTLIGTRLGDCGGNTNITFPASKTVYLNTPAGGNWNALNWSNTIGGATSDNYYPLPQDIALLDDVGLNTGTTITVSQFYNMPTFRNGARTKTVRLNVTIAGLCFYGSPIWASNWTVSASGFYFFSRAGNTLDIFITNATGSINLHGGGNFRLLTNQLPGFDTRAFQPFWGKLILNGFKLNIGRLYFNSAFYKEIDWSVSGSEIISTVTTSATPLLTTNNNNTFFTGTNKIWRVNGALASGSTMIIASAAFAEGNVPDFYISNGLSGSSITLSGNFNKLDFTGCASTIPNWGGTIYGDVNLGNATFSAGTGAWTLGGSSVQTITTNGKTVDWPITQTKTGSGGVQFSDNFTLGSSRAYTWNSGSFDMNGKTISMTAITQSGSGAKSWVGTGGSLVLSSTTPILGTGTNLTSTSTGKIRLTATTNKTFNGNGQQYPALENGATGSVIITGSNTFYDLNTTVLPTTFTFTAATTTTFKNFTINGTAGNLVTLNSTTSTPFILYAKDTYIDCNYLNISNSTARGGALWVANTTSTNGGGNTGWIFNKRPTNFFFNN